MQKEHSCNKIINSCIINRNEVKTNIMKLTPKNWCQTNKILNGWWDDYMYENLEKSYISWNNKVFDHGNE